jgi:anti-anti-sigma factor
MKLIVENDTMKIESLSSISIENYRAVTEQVLARLRNQTKLLEVDLSGVTFIDTRGLTTLLALRKAISAIGGTIVLIAPTRAVDQILKLTRLDRVFEIKLPNPERPGVPVGDSLKPTLRATKVPA